MPHMDDELPEEELPFEDPDIIENPDGSATYFEPQEQQQSTFDENLAEKLPESKLISIAEQLIELIDLDKESRKKADEIYQEGLRRTGLGDEAPGGANFEGASKAVHPVLAEACVDYSSSAIKELFPPDGPVKIHSFAENTDPNEIERAENKRDFMNWELVEEVKEYRSELEILLTQQPLSGCQYMKIYRDIKLNRNCVEFVSSDLVFRPYAATSFMCSQRFTVVVPLTKYDYEQRVKTGLYRDIELLSDPFLPEETQAQTANDKIEGKDQPTYNKDGLRNFYEVYVNFEVEGEEPAPYIITIDEFTHKIVSIYRNWEENDPKQTALDWLVDFEFIPWRGAGGIGLTHLIGSLAGSATGALRALLDAAHLNNFPGAVKLKGARSSGENIRVGPTEITELECPANIDDVRKLIMPLPFNQPSPVLFQLLGWLTEAAKGVVTTAEEKISDASNQMPVGTTLALIEQGSKVASAIHMRLHEAQKRVFTILQRLNYKYFDPQKQINKFGRVLVPREDFLNSGNIQPVSDPFMFSESQRFAQIQGVLQMSQDPTVPWNKIAIYKRALRLMHVQAPQELIQEPPPPVSADPVTEITAAMSGQMVQAKPEMDHMFHIKEQLEYLLDPVFGAANPVLVNQGFQTILNDVFQHLMFLYQQMKQHAMQMAQEQVVQLMQMQMSAKMIPPEAHQMLIQQQLQSPQVVATVKQLTDQGYAQMREQLAPYVQMMQQADQLVKAKLPPPPVDPQAQAAIHVAQMQEQTKMQLGQMQESNKLQLAQIKNELDLQAAQQKAEIEMAKLELEKLVQLQINPAQTQAQVQTELVKNDDDNRQHQMTELLKNHEDNQTQLQIAAIREQGENDRRVQELAQQAMIDVLSLKQQDETNKQNLEHQKEVDNQNFEQQKEMNKQKMKVEEQRVKQQTAAKAKQPKTPK